MDAYDSKEKIDSGEKLKAEKFVEMKTSRIVENERQDRTFRRFKILKWYITPFCNFIPQELILILQVGSILSGGHSGGPLWMEG